ncbi:hypothetical protein [Enterobacter roggenkampii]|nr:hypothetical protein [Enterobacter roggenkampii]
MFAKVSMVGNAGKNKRRYECDAYDQNDMLEALQQLQTRSKEIFSKS